jgi:hypothetical protein
MFLGLEAIDEEGLKKYRKRVSLGRNFEAVEFARSLGVNVAINLIADPDWDHERFRIVRDWCLEMPDVINISVNTPYPGTESWITDGRRLQTRDYRLFDIQHAVLPTRLPLAEFYRELVTTQRSIYRRHLDWRQHLDASGIVALLLLQGQTQFRQKPIQLEQRLSAGCCSPTMPHRWRMRYLPPRGGRDEGRGGGPTYVHAPRGCRGERSTEQPSALSRRPARERRHEAGCYCPISWRLTPRPCSSAR